MLIKPNIEKLSQNGAVLRGVSAIDTSSQLEPPFVFAGNIAPLNHLSIGAFSYTQGGVC